jgi:hypothetical protein
MNSVVFAVPIIWSINATFTVADIVYAVGKSWLPKKWAVSQIVFSVLNMGASAGLIYYNRDCEGGPALFGASLAFSSLLLTHGILSLIYYKNKDFENHSAYIPDIGLTTNNNNAIGTMRWVF